MNLFVRLQHFIPQHGLTAVLNWAARLESPWIKNPFIRTVSRLFNIDLADYQRQTPAEYKSFNDFFTRELRAETRPISAFPQVASPVDGTISAIGYIREDSIFQAKGKDYSLKSLLAGHAELSQAFVDGCFMTIYLAPYNYHRIHTPIPGRLTQMHCVPGRLFSVNTATVEAVDNLFAINERVVSVFEHNNNPYAVVKVGALNVGSIETVWSGVVTPNKSIRREYYEHGQAFEQGEEIARFNFGSTVILLFPEKSVAWNADLAPGDRIKLGQALGVFN